MDFNLFISPDKISKNPLKTGITYDVIIIGGGPAAQTAAVYCMRKGVKTGIITKNFGGQIADTGSIENYMGYKLITGNELNSKFKDQVEQFDVDILEGIEVVSIKLGLLKTILVTDGSQYTAKSIIITTGKSWRKLNVPGEADLTGKGVAYCSICDAPLFSDKKTAVVGGGNSGIETAIDLAKVAQHVTIIQLMPELTADKILIEKLNKYQNITILYESEVVEILGAVKVESIITRNVSTGITEKLILDGIFIEIGLVPNTGAFKDILYLNEYGEIIIDSACRTNIEGIFAAGDVTSVPFKQIIIAAGEGAKAALSACDYVLHH